MQKFENYNKGLIYTGIKDCIDCNKCIHECPILKANVVISDLNDDYKVCVDHKECILCGTCLDTCIHNVRQMRDDCDAFLADLQTGKNYSLIIAPSFYLNYAKEYKHILGYLKSLGVKSFYPASLGANITVWGYLNYINKNKDVSYISQPCPTVVTYIEKHKPELLPKLMPVQSPMMCTAIYLKRYKGNMEDLAFLGPCIAKKSEIGHKRGLGLIRHNITFKNLLEYITDKGIDLSEYPPVEDEAEWGLGALFPVPGGLGENLKYYLGPGASIFQLEGEHILYDFFRSLVKKPDKSPITPLFMDTLNCDGGCAYGTGTQFRKSNDYSIAYRSIALRKTKYGAMNAENPDALLDSAERLALLNEKFKDLSLEDFICEYERDNSKDKHTVSNSEIEAIFRDKLQKLTENDQHVDCSACGYKSCWHMAEAIALGINYPGNCVYYTRQSLAKSLKENLENSTLMEQRLMAMLNASPILCAIFDDKLNITDVNQEAANILRLKDKQEYVDRLFDLCPEYQPDGLTSREKAHKVVNDALQNGRGYIPEWLHQTYDGEIVPIEVYLERVTLGAKDVVVIYGRDLRAHKEMMTRIETAIEREQMANSAKSRFLSNMSHEIRTPMSAIIGMTDIAKNTDDISRKDDCLGKIAKASMHLLGIVNQILDISKIEAEQFKLELHTFHFKKMIDELASVLSVSIEEKHLTFDVEVDDAIPRDIISDEIRLAQILTNLLGNAIKFTPEGGKVLLSAKLIDDGDIIRMEVSDSGIGIPREMQSFLFDDFMQVETDFSRNYAGTGLGLSISRRIVEMMGGKIWVESVPGKGASFIFTVPVKVGKIENEESRALFFSSDPLNIEPDCFKGYTILIAEDVEINREIVVSLLEPTGIEIDCAIDGASALLMFRTYPDRYDLILMDVQMPGMDGLNATRFIREIGTEKAKNIPILALTANVFQEDIDVCLEAGMNDHLSKPLDMNQIIGKLKQYLEKQ